jgi:adenosylhomocysteine nucleosidase
VHRSTPDPKPSRRIAILAPMRNELQPLLAPLRLESSGGLEPGLLQGSIGRVEVVAALAGIGMTAAAQCTTRMLEAVSPDHLVVVGIAGGIGSSVAVGDLIVPDLVMDLASGEKLCPAPLGGLPRHGALASCDALLEGPEEVRSLEAQGVVAIDMETAAIAAVCERHGCPWSVFRAVSDQADGTGTDADVLALVDSEGRPNPAAVARFVLTRPHRIPQLVRLGRGAKAATGTAARAVVDALASL